ncbi:hypothetical protein I8H83_00450 [Candidatus Saccharibacteria bacterium]|nr:hypothetical protein [Candidatus Saccharibacteria bacterium]
MYGIIVFVHVVAMVSSMALMSGAVGLGFLGKKIALRSATLGVYATVIGTISGIGLLLDNPLSLQCVFLTAYVAGVSVLYYFGFGFGVMSDARLIRQRL